MISAEFVETIQPTPEPKLPRYWYEICITQLELAIVSCARDDEKSYDWDCHLDWGIDDGRANISSIKLNNEQIHRVMAELEKFGFNVEIEFKEGPTMTESLSQKFAHLFQRKNDDDDDDDDEGEEWKNEEGAEREIDCLTITWGKKNEVLS